MPKTQEKVTLESIYALLLQMNANFNRRLSAIEKAEHKTKPEPREEIPNAATIAAFEEGDAILEGRKPGYEFHSLEEMFACLDADDDEVV
jgi:hypothetical protein